MARDSFLTQVVRGAPHRAALALVLGLAVACGGGEPSAPPEGALVPSSLDGLAPADGAAAPERTPPSLPETGPRVVVLGDSLSAGLHLPADEAWPAVAAALLAAEGLPIDLVNAGVSGDTTAGGLARLDWLLRQDPRLMVVELGGNDGLRGVALDAIEANLRAIVERLVAEEVEVLLLGMQMPPNYGADYATGFEQVFERIAADTGVAHVPFFVEGVITDPDLVLPDGLHPNTAGHRRLAENLLPHLRPLVRGLSTEPTD